MLVASGDRATLDHSLGGKSLNNYSFRYGAVELENVKSYK